MTESDAPSLVFRKTSFTMRDRFAPASPCSTFTRTRDTFRFVRFSLGVSLPWRGFFFRLVRLLHRWFVSLEAAILVQDRPRRIRDVFQIGDPFVVGRARVG